MSGKLCFGIPYNNAGAGHLRSSKAFCEALNYRASGTALQRPKADNPHADGSDANASWDLGWDIANTSAGGSVANLGCCGLIGDIPA